MSQSKNKSVAGASSRSSAHVFIISWVGRHENAVAIAREVRGAADKVSIVYSDPDPDLMLEADCDLLRRPNELFWSDKFSACLDACEGDLLLVIHADCTCKDWSAMVRNCREQCDRDLKIGVWAPLIEGTFWNIAYTRIMGVPGAPLSIVANTDAIVFALTAPVIARMKTIRYEKSIYGWGIDWIFVSFAFSNDLLAVVDHRIVVLHPATTGYQSSSALEEMNALIGQLNLREYAQYAILNRFFLAIKEIKVAEIKKQLEARRKSIHPNEPSLRDQ